MNYSFFVFIKYSNAPITSRIHSIFIKKNFELNKLKFLLNYTF